jgi:endogenous inhibitor of DNA gyrase (YacG/DUF329 family)
MSREDAKDAKGPRCPICRDRVASRPENPAFPFCSERCRLVDLGNWLGESYRIPALDDTPDESEVDEN